jgi:prepilin-type N-terminal cleavage/methylation domain-containing protein
MSMQRSQRKWLSMDRSAGNSGTREAFTLIEVLVVVAIIALLISILLPSLQEARRQARLVVCLNNLHQVSVALYSYQADYRGKPPQWTDYNEQIADGLALWVQGPAGLGHSTRLGMLFPKYVGNNENVFYCPDGTTNGLLNKGEAGGDVLYPWSNYGTDRGWAYGSYEYRPRYAMTASGQLSWLGADYDKFRQGRMSIAADGFAGYWDAFGPFPSHTPVQRGGGMLYYNVAYMDGSASGVKDFLSASPVDPSSKEFGTRAAAPAQQRPNYRNPPREGGLGETVLPPEYTPLKPGPNNAPLPDNRTSREHVLRTSDHIERGWTFFDRR